MNTGSLVSRQRTTEKIKRKKERLDISSREVRGHERRHTADQHQGLHQAGRGKGQQRVRSKGTETEKTTIPTRQTNPAPRTVGP